MTAALPDDVLEVDSDWYTIDEIDKIEELIGDDFTKFMNTPGKKAAHMRVLATIVKWRTDPDFPIEQAGSLKVAFTKRPVPPTSGNGSEPA